MQNLVPICPNLTLVHFLMFQYFLKTCNIHTEVAMSEAGQSWGGLDQTGIEQAAEAGTSGVLARLSDMKPITGPSMKCASFRFR